VVARGIRARPRTATISRVIRLAIRVPRAYAEMVLAELLDLAPSGLEERELPDGLTEYAIYGARGELPALPQLRATIGDALVEVSTRELPDDWAERWKRFHRGVVIEPPGSGGGTSPPGVPGVRVPALHVRAPWVPGIGRADALEIVIDPGQAFGTGSHATTTLCLELLLELAAEGVRGPVLDLGTGTGVLAIAASLLGFAPVQALDVEQASVDAALANAGRNHAEIAVRRVDVRRPIAPWPTAPLVLANLVRPLLIELARALPAEPTHLVAGGLLGPEVDEVVAAFAARFRLQERKRCQRAEWAAVWLSAPGARPSQIAPSRGRAGPLRAARSPGCQ
jgi:ribosomal protein L11 methyltransferase